MKYSQSQDTEISFSLYDLNLEPTHSTSKKKAGWVYFIVCRETERCKIGFTNGKPEKRLRALQTGAAGKLMLMAAQPGTVETERALHERFAQHHAHGEWFEMNQELFAYITGIVWMMANVYRDCGKDFEEWMKIGLRMLNDGMAEVPDELMALTE